MKKIAVAVIIATGVFASAVQAAPVTSLPGGIVVPMAASNVVSSGPITQAPGITWSSATQNSLFGYTDDYGFSNNGLWQGSPPMIGTNDGTSTMEYAFSTLQAGVGGLINYARTGNGYEGAPATITVYDSSHTLIESSILNFSTNGIGEFHGFQEATASIAYFSLSGAYIGLRNLTITTNVSAVPEPESYAMLLAGLGLMGFVARRRKQAA